MNTEHNSEDAETGGGAVDMFPSMSDFSFVPDERQEGETNNWTRVVPRVSVESLKPVPGPCQPGFLKLLFTRGEGISSDLQSQLNEIAFGVRKEISGDNLTGQLNQREIKNLGDRLEKVSRTYIEEVCPELLEDRGKLEVTLLSFLHRNRSNSRRKTSSQQFNLVRDQSYSFSLCCAVATHVMAMQVMGLVPFPVKTKREEASSGADKKDLVIQFTKDPSVEIRLPGEIEDVYSRGDKTVKFRRSFQLDERRGDFLELLSTPNYKSKQAPLIFFRAKVSELDLSLLPPKTILVLIERDREWVFFTGFFEVERLGEDRKLWKQVYNKEVLVLNLPIESNGDFDEMMTKWSGNMSLLQESAADVFIENGGSKSGNTSRLKVDRSLLPTEKLNIGNILGAMPPDEVDAILLGEPEPEFESGYDTRFFKARADRFGVNDGKQDTMATKLVDIEALFNSETPVNDIVPRAEGAKPVKDVTPPLSPSQDPIPVGKHTGGTSGVGDADSNTAFNSQGDTTVIDTGSGLRIQSEYIASYLDDPEFIKSISSSKYFSSVAEDLVNLVKLLNEYNLEMIEAYVNVAHCGIENEQSWEIEERLLGIVASLQNIHRALEAELVGDYSTALNTLTRVVLPAINSIDSPSPEVATFRNLLLDFVDVMMIRFHAAQIRAGEEEGTKMIKDLDNLRSGGLNFGVIKDLSNIEHFPGNTGRIVMGLIRAIEERDLVKAEQLALNLKEAIKVMNATMEVKIGLNQIATLFDHLVSAIKVRQCEQDGEVREFVNWGHGLVENLMGRVPELGNFCDHLRKLINVVQGKDDQKSESDD